MVDKLDILHPQVIATIKELNLSFDSIECDPNLADTAEFCANYGFGSEQTCNAIIAAGKSAPTKYACCVILATCKLDVNKAVCKQLEIKKCSFASADQTKELTGMEIGGVTPVGVSGIPILIDARVMENEQVVLGGGNRSSKLLINPQELLKLPNLHVVQDLAIPR